MQIDRKNMERITRVNARNRDPAQRGGRRPSRRGSARCACRPTSPSASARRSRSRRKSFQQLQLVLILAVLLVYAVMASQYESLRDPFIIMFSIPVAAIGVVLSLLLTGTSFSMQAYIGIIMLAGIVVSNAILLVDYINTLRRRDGMPLREAVELGGRTRLRPILMTSIATMLGLVPMAIGIGEGGELQAPLARVVIGGLLTSTLVTLVLVPAVYTLFEEGWSGLFRKSAKRALGRWVSCGSWVARSTRSYQHSVNLATCLATQQPQATPPPFALSPGRASRRRSPPAAPARTAARETADAARRDRPRR